MEKKEKEIREWGFTTQMQFFIYCSALFSCYWGGNLQSRLLNFKQHL